MAEKSQARKQGVVFRVEKRRGKGSHVTLVYDGRKSVCPDGELVRGTFLKVLENMGADEADL